MMGRQVQDIGAAGNLFGIGIPRNRGIYVLNHAFLFGYVELHPFTCQFLTEQRTQRGAGGAQTGLETEKVRRIF